MSTSTAKKPAVLPKLTDHPRYAAALARLAEIEAMAREPAAEFARVQAELNRIRALELEERLAERERSKVAAVEIAANAILAGKLPPSELTVTRVQLVQRQESLQTELAAIGIACRKFTEAEVTPARREAQVKFIPGVLEAHWKPAMRRVAAAMIEYAAARVAGYALLGELDAADLSAEPIDRNILPFDHMGPPWASFDRPRHFVTDLVRAGHLSPSDPLLASIPPARD